MKNLLSKPHPFIWGLLVLTAACGILANLPLVPQTPFGIVWRYVSLSGFALMLAWGIVWTVIDVLRRRRQANG
jgi:hypothetical protein